MLAAERRAKIVEELERRGAMRVMEFADLLGVSDMTIRRDLDLLARRGLVDKVHGGATRRSPSTDEPGFEAKSRRQREEKEAIARLAATLVAPGMAVGLSAGTTTTALARELRTIDRLTVLTNSVSVADVLQTQADPGANRTVLLTGGIRTPSDALVGPVATAALAQLNLDIVFLGVHGMTEDAGFTTPNMLEAETDRALIAAGRRLVVLADHTKWGTVGISTITDLGAADIVITDSRMPDHVLAELEGHVGEVRVAPVGAVAPGRRPEQRP